MTLLLSPDTASRIIAAGLVKAVPMRTPDRLAFFGEKEEVDMVPWVAVLCQWRGTICGPLSDFLLELVADPRLCCAMKTCYRLASCEGISITDPRVGAVAASMLALYDSRKEE